MAKNDRDATDDAAFQRVIERFLSTPPQPRASRKTKLKPFPTKKAKRQSSKAGGTRDAKS